MGYIKQEIFKGFSIGDFSPVRIMGVLNLSPESFYKDSFIPNEQLIKKMKSFVENGATILDLGARSTAPWSKPISLEEEKKRIANSLKLIPENISKDIIISIDTQYADVADMSLLFAEKNGIKMIINDISCFKTDPRLKDVILKYKCPTILMATFEKPGDAKTPEEILDSLQNTICELKDSGFDTNKIIIDPGVGKWVKDKTYEYDLAILDNLQSFRCFGCPVLMGLSRKSFLGAILDEPDAKNREIGSLAATSIAVYNGAHIIRTHDVDRDMVQTIKTASAIRKKPVQVTQNKRICEVIEPFKKLKSAYYYLLDHGVTTTGSAIMKRKMHLWNLLLKNVTAPQALILKQELLARGGEVAMHKDVISTEHGKYDDKFEVILTGNEAQFDSLITKLKGQSLDLDKIGQLIQKLLKKDREILSNYRKEIKKEHS